VRLHCKLWKETGHNFNKLRDLLIPDRTEMRISDIIAVTKAATLKEVCLHDVDRGMQLLEGIEVSFGPSILKAAVFDHLNCTLEGSVTVLQMQCRAHAFLVK